MGNRPIKAKWQVLVANPSKQTWVMEVHALAFFKLEKHGGNVAQVKGLDIGERPESHLLNFIYNKIYTIFLFLTMMYLSYCIKI